MKRFSIILAWIVAIGLPWAGVSFSLLGSINLAATYAMVAVSIVLLTGWVGQISLGHAALVGIGAYATGWITEGLGIGFPFNLPFSALAAALVALLLGAVAVRVRGLYLAVATLVFSWMASEFLFRQDWLTSNDQIGEQLVGAANTFPSFNFTDRRAFASVAWVTVLLVVMLLANLRVSKTGRAFLTVRGSEFAAASLGIDVVRTKLTAFAISGALAGLAGNLSLTQARTVTADQFTFTASLLFLAIAVVGGLESLGGAIASAIMFAGLTELFYQVEALGGFLDIVSGGLLAVTLLLYPDGLAGLGAQLGGFVSRTASASLTRVRPRAGHSNTVLPDVGPDPTPHSTPSAALPPPGTRVLTVDGITVKFGGLTAVSEASLFVDAGEIVGLIGPNGAGKTTLFNAIAGFNTPVAGSITLLGRDMSGMPVHTRAAAGMARTFQQIQLLGKLTVTDNLLVASHATDPTGIWEHVVWTPRAIANDRAVRDRARAAIERVGLDEVAESKCADLPFGVLRRVELARALVTGFPFVMLDEPASGLDDHETDAFAELLLSLKDDGFTLLLIEHDVEMVMRVCDRINVLDQGRIIAAGTATEVRKDPGVLAAYLGHAEVAEDPQEVDA